VPVLVSVLYLRLLEFTLRYQMIWSVSSVSVLYLRLH